MRRAILLLALSGLAIGVVGCQSFNVRTDWDSSASFDAFQHYFWLEPPKAEDASPFADNTLLRKRVRFAIEDELAQRGFREVEAREDADFLVTYSVILEQRLQVDGYGLGAGAGTLGDRYYGFGQAYSGANIRAYQESTLIIDFLDPDNEDLVWRGWGSGIVETRDRDRRRERLARGVEAILAVFPPKPESS